MTIYRIFYFSYFLHYIWIKRGFMNTKKFSYLSATEIFLLSPDKKEVLLLKRSPTKKVVPNYYAGVGGKMDSDSIESPYDTAYREIEEETGYTKADIGDLHLSGVYTVFDKFGKWNIFEFRGQVKKKLFDKFHEMEEGVLEWVPIDSVEEYKLIPDLKNGLLTDLLTIDKILWVTVEYDENEKLLSLKKKK